APAPPSRGLSILSLHDALPISFPGIPELLLLFRGKLVPEALVDHRDVVEHRDLVDEGRLDARLVQLAGTQRLVGGQQRVDGALRSEEHTSELQSRENLVCRLLL